MTQLFGSHIYNYVFIDKNYTDPLRDKLRSSQLTDGVFSLLRRPPGSLVPGKVCSIGLHPGLWGPLLCYVVAPTWKDKHQGKWWGRERHVLWMTSSHNEVFWRHQQPVCCPNCTNHFHGAINSLSQFPLLSFNKLSQMVQFSEWREFSVTEKLEQPHFTQTQEESL